MKKLLLLALMFAGFTASAQDGRALTLAERENITSEQRLENQLKSYTVQLDLNADQKEQVKKILSERNSQMEARKKEMVAKKAQGEMTDAERQKMRDELNESSELQTAELKKVLTPEQFAKWEALKAQRAEKMKDAKARSQAK